VKINVNNETQHLLWVPAILFGVTYFQIAA
jgi:hypothetical protein